ncbi:Thiamine-monophosphate kinase [compost metagenome]
MEPTLAQLGEDRAIALIAETLVDVPVPEGWVGIGDDAAVTTLTPGLQAVTTTDILVEDVHFRRSTTSARELGWKAIAVNVSDVASMGALPRWATVSVALPKDCSASWVRELYQGIAEASRAVGLAIVGGDTTGSPGPLMVSVTVVGETERPLLRSGAKAGDLVCVTGPIGDSAAGLWLLEHGGETPLSEADAQALRQAHRRPRPHVAEGRALAKRPYRMSVLDNSDGLGRSALILAQANRVTVEVEASRLPISDAMRALAAHAGRDPLDWALWGGEDYNLVLSVEPAGLDAVRQAMEAAGGRLWQVGRMSEGPAIAVLKKDDHAEPLRNASAFQHFGS